MKKMIMCLFICFLLAPSILVAASEQSSVVIEMDYVIIRPSDDGSVAVMHMTNFKNQQNEVYQGDGKSKAVLSINIPEGAKNLQVHDNSLAMSETDYGFMTKKAIPASESMVVPYSYFLNNKKDGFDFKYDYPVQSLQFLVPEGAGSLQINGLKYTIQGLLEFEGTKYYTYNISSVEREKPFTVIYDQNKQPSPEDVQAMDNQSASSTTETSKSTNPDVGNITHSAPVFHNPGHLRMWYQSPLRGFNPHIFLGVILFIIIGGIVCYSYFRWKNKLQEDQRLADKEEQAFLQLIAKRKAIMDKIVELEEGYSGGQITDEDYHKKLEAYKHHLLQVKLNLQKYTE